MRKKSKDLPTMLMAHLTRVDRVTRRKKGITPYACADVFVLGESKSQIEERLPGLLERGLQVIRYYRLTPSAGGTGVFVHEEGTMPIVLPKSGVYETCEWAWLTEKEEVRDA